MPIISKIKAKGFKCGSFDQEFDDKTLIIGPTGSGKSSRTQAVELLINGFISDGKQSKQLSAILANYGCSDKITVTGQIGKKFFTRCISAAATRTGSASQVFMVGSKKASKEEFAVAMAKEGDPSIFDAGTFLALSDNKKLELISTRFPSEVDFSKTDGLIAANQQRLDNVRAQIRARRNTIQSLEKAKAELGSPKGTLAEVEKDISDKEKELSKARARLRRAIQANANSAAEAAMKEREAEAEKRRQEDAKAEKEDAVAGPGPRPLPSITPGPNQKEREAQPVQGAPLIPLDTVLAIGEKVLATMKKTGCVTCAASLVLKSELAKLKKGVQ